MVAAAAGVPAVAAMALAGVLAAAPPVRAAAASASRVPAALLDQHLGRGLVPSCRGLRRRAPRPTGTICGHPKMIPSRARRPPRGGRPISMSCALTCACLRAGPRRSIHAGRNGTLDPDRTGVQSCRGRGGLAGGGTRRSARTATSGAEAGDRVLASGTQMPPAEAARAPVVSCPLTSAPPNDPDEAPVMPQGPQRLSELELRVIEQVMSNLRGDPIPVVESRHDAGEAVRRLQEPDHPIG